MGWKLKLRDPWVLLRLQWELKSLLKVLHSLHVLATIITMSKLIMIQETLRTITISIIHIQEQWMKILMRAHLEWINQSHLIIKWELESMSQNNRDKLTTLTTMEVTAHNLLEEQGHYQDRLNVIMTLTVTFRETRVH